VLAKLKAGRPPFAPVPVASAPTEGAAPVLRQTESSDVERDDIGIECAYKPQLKNASFTMFVGEREDR
jgi:hypothetical protein